jgi:pyruvate formate lyase activating enzyme
MRAELTMRSGLVFNIQRFSIHDGPGIRTTVFLKGCPLACSWCHNPEGQGRGPELMTIETRCLRCGTCFAACPAANGAPGPLPYRAAACSGCGACIPVCPNGARRIAGARMTVDQVMAGILKDRIFYDESGGGVTLSGGEPLAQSGFLCELLAGCREADVHTALDTCGHAPWDDLAVAIPLVDLVLYDVKFTDGARHQAHTGVSNELILENLARLGRAGVPIWIRIPVLPGLNDDPEELRALAAVAASTPSVRRVNLLPYHRVGTHKFSRVGRRSPLEGVAPPSAERLEDVAAAFAAAGLAVTVGG